MYKLRYHFLTSYDNFPECAYFFPGCNISSMALTKVESISNILQDILEKSNDCLKDNDYMLFLLDKVSKNLRDGCSLRQIYNVYNYEKSNKGSGDDGSTIRITDGMDRLEIILFKKLRENSRLKALNENLLMNTKQKAQKIKELTDAITLNSQQVQTAEISQKAAEISKYKDKIGRYNVEIQKLKKQINTESKKLQNIKAKHSALEKRKEIEAARINRINEKRNKSHPIKGNLNEMEKNEKIKVYRLKASNKNLDEIYRQEVLEIIKSEEKSIFDATLDEPKNLDDLDDDSEENSLREL